MNERLNEWMNEQQAVLLLVMKRKGGMAMMFLSNCDRSITRCIIAPNERTTNDERRMNKPINQQQPTNQLNQSTNERTNQSINQPINNNITL